MKFVFRLIGIIVVVVILLSAVLCYLDSKNLLSGKLGRLVSSLRSLGQQAWIEIRIFLGESGITEDAASILDQGANYFRDSVSPHQTERPGSNALPAGYVSKTVTPTPEPVVATASPTPITTATPAPFLTMGTPSVG